MTASRLTLTFSTCAHKVLATARNGLRERRQARAEHRQLKRELASYTTIAEVDDLLHSLRGQDQASTDEIRAIVARNLQGSQRIS